ncbi:MAG: glycosyltransferase [Actinomycetota bacterium]
MTDVPSDVRALALEREEKRKTKDYQAADDLRDRIREQGFEVVDTPTGTEFESIEPSKLSHADVEAVLDARPVVDFSVQWVVQGWPEDAVRGIESFQRNAGGRSVQYVVVDAAAPERFSWPDGVEVVALERDFGWAELRNAGLRRATGRMVVVVDGSVEADGDVFGPLESALGDPGIGVCGPFGIVTDDLREFRESDGPEVDAIEGYLMAFRHDVLTPAGLFDEKFKFYRSADIEFSFRVKNEGLRAVVVPVPLRRHEHRMWASTAPEERDRLSKRNFYRFLDRWRGRTDLTVAGGSG